MEHQNSIQKCYDLWHRHLPRLEEERQFGWCVCGLDKWNIHGVVQSRYNSMSKRGIN